MRSVSEAMKRALCRLVHAGGQAACSTQADRAPEAEGERIAVIGAGFVFFVAARAKPPTDAPAGYPRHGVRRSSRPSRVAGAELL
jgi:hypothetical protein